MDSQKLPEAAFTAMGFLVSKTPRRASHIKIRCASEPPPPFLGKENQTMAAFAQMMQTMMMTQFKNRNLGLDNGDRDVCVPGLRVLAKETGESLHFSPIETPPRGHLALTNGVGTPVSAMKSLSSTESFGSESDDSQHLRGAPSPDAAAKARPDSIFLEADSADAPKDKADRPTAENIADKLLQDLAAVNAAKAAQPKSLPAKRSSAAMSGSSNGADEDVSEDLKYPGTKAAKTFHYTRNITISTSADLKRGRVVSPNLRGGKNPSDRKFPWGKDPKKAWARLVEHVHKLTKKNAKKDTKHAKKDDEDSEEDEDDEEDEDEEEDEDDEDD